METQEVFSVVNGVLLALLLAALFVFVLKLVFTISPINKRVNKLLDSADESIGELNKTIAELRATVEDVNYKLGRLNVLFEAVEKLFTQVTKVRETLNKVNLLSKFKRKGKGSESYE